jgi:hypothetical protein
MQSGLQMRIAREENFPAPPLGTTRVPLRAVEPSLGRVASEGELERNARGCNALQVLCTRGNNKGEAQRQSSLGCPPLSSLFECDAFALPLAWHENAPFAIPARSNLSTFRDAFQVEHVAVCHITTRFAHSPFHDLFLETDPETTIWLHLRVAGFFAFTLEESLCHSFSCGILQGNTRGCGV